MKKIAAIIAFMLLFATIPTSFAVNGSSEINIEIGGQTHTYTPKYTYTSVSETTSAAREIFLGDAFDHEAEEEIVLYFNFSTTKVECCEEYYDVNTTEAPINASFYKYPTQFTANDMIITSGTIYIDQIETMEGNAYSGNFDLNLQNGGKLTGTFHAPLGKPSGDSTPPPPPSDDHDQPPSDSIFPDVPSTHPNYEAIKYLKEHNVIGGYPDGSFKPEQAVNRAEALKIILLGDGRDVPDVVSNAGFSDVDPYAWYAKYIDYAKNEGIVKGHPDGTFHPGDTVNLAENLKMLEKTAGVNVDEIKVYTDPYADVPKDEWFAPYCQYAKDQNLIDADANNKVYPGQGMTRGTLSEAMYRLIYVIENGKPYPGGDIAETPDDDNDQDDQDDDQDDQDDVTDLVINSVQQIATTNDLDRLTGTSTMEIKAMTSDNFGNTYFISKVGSYTLSPTGVFKISNTGVFSYYVAPDSFAAYTGVDPQLTAITTAPNGDVYVADSESGTIFRIYEGIVFTRIQVYISANILLQRMGKPDVFMGDLAVNIADMAITSNGNLFLYDDYLGFNQEHKPGLWYVDTGGGTYTPLESSPGSGEFSIHSMEIDSNDNLLVLAETTQLIKINTNFDYIGVIDQMLPDPDENHLLDMFLDKDDNIFFYSEPDYAYIPILHGSETVGPYLKTKATFTPEQFFDPYIYNFGADVLLKINLNAGTVQALNTENILIGHGEYSDYNLDFEHMSINSAGNIIAFGDLAFYEIDMK